MNETLDDLTGSPGAASNGRRGDAWTGHGGAVARSAFDGAIGVDRRAAARVAWRRHPVTMALRRVRAPRRAPALDPTTSNAEILRRLRALPSGVWSYAWEDDDVRHLGPMAQDFWDAFGLGTSDRRIDLGDALGVCMAAICALADRVEELESTLAATTQGPPAAGSPGPLR